MSEHTEIAHPEDASFTPDEASEQTGYLDEKVDYTGSSHGPEPAMSSHDDASSQTLRPSSLFAHLAQRAAAQSRPQPTSSSSSSRNIPRTQSEYDDPSSWSTSRSSNARSPSSRNRHQTSSNTDSDRADSEYSDSDSDADSALLQKEWEEQVAQLKLMFQIIVFPFFGKFLGRKYAYFLFDRYRRVEGLFTRSFWGL